jgi:hypothetical protein
LKKILPLFSYLFHPIFVPTLACVFYFFVNENYVSYSNLDMYLVMTQVVLLTICIPISFFYLLKSLGKIDTIMVANLSQRKLPLVFQLFLLIVLIFKGATLERVPELFFYFLSGISSTILILVFLYYKIKVSLHLFGMGSLLFFIIGISLHNQCNYLIYIAITLFLTGFVASSRLEMNAHDNRELFLGFLTGIVPQLFLWFFWL